MKQILSYLISLLLVLSSGLTVSASGSTMLTAAVPAVEYMLCIPVNQCIEYGTESAYIGALSVSDASGFTVGKNLKITVAHTPFEAEDSSSAVPYEITALYQYPDQSGTVEQALTDGVLLFKGNAEKGLSVPCITAAESEDGGQKLSFIGLQLRASSGDWAKASAGTYTSTITYTAEVVTAED